MKKRVLFLIHDLGHGGAEKVLVNLVNNMDSQRFDISVIALFGGGVNEQFLKPHIHYRAVFSRTFRGNTHLMKLLTPKQLHRWFIKEKYDIEVSYLEGPSARIISGCPDPDTKLVSWIHCTMRSAKGLARSFRTMQEAAWCYNRFDRLIFVSEGVKKAFLNVCSTDNVCEVLYNTNETDRILAASREPVSESVCSAGEILLCSMGKLTANKGFDRLLRIHRRLRAEGFPVHTCILGEGEERGALMQYVQDHGLSDSVMLPGYRTNPYQYVSRSDIYVCASLSEGFSTAATEALIVGTPVCTVEVSGMKEMLGEHDEWGIVTENDEDALYQGIRRLLDDPQLLAHYKEKAAQRGKAFRTDNTVRAVEEMLEKL